MSLEDKLPEKTEVDARIKDTSDKQSVVVITTKRITSGYYTRVYRSPSTGLKRFISGPLYISYQDNLKAAGKVHTRIKEDIESGQLVYRRGSLKDRLVEKEE